MTDRELLELAAKAAGHRIDPIDAMHEPDEWACWNPLTDDGDALRLAVKLNILESPNWLNYRNALVFIEMADPLDATRRAIVRAAAEIGRTMP